MRAKSLLSDSQQLHRLWADWELVPLSSSVNHLSPVKGDVRVSFRQDRFLFTCRTVRLEMDMGSPEQTCGWWFVFPSLFDGPFFLFVFLVFFPSAAPTQNCLSSPARRHPPALRPPLQPAPWTNPRPRPL